MKRTEYSQPFVIIHKYKYTVWTSKTALNVYTDAEVLIGKTTYVAVRARSNSVSNGKYYDCMLLRSQMEPIVTRSGTKYYRGLNNINRAEMSLNKADIDGHYLDYYYLGTEKTDMFTQKGLWDAPLEADGRSIGMVLKFN